MELGLFRGLIQTLQQVYNHPDLFTWESHDPLYIPPSPPPPPLGPFQEGFEKLQTNEPFVLLLIFFPFL